MSVSPIGALVFDSEGIIDDYLRDLLVKSENISMDVVRVHAQRLNFADDRLRSYFINKGQELLKT